MCGLVVFALVVLTPRFLLVGEASLMDFDSLGLKVFDALLRSVSHCPGKGARLQVNAGFLRPRVELRSERPYAALLALLAVAVWAPSHPLAEYLWATDGLSDISAVVMVRLRHEKLLDLFPPLPHGLLLRWNV